MGSAVVQVSNGPDGLGHALGSVKKMARLARAGAHSYAIRSLATRITRNVPSKDKRGELVALYRWVRDNIRYRHDPRGLEWIQSPERTVEERAGDCDDIGTLLSALAQSIGFSMMYRTVGPTVHNQQHVSTEAQCEGEWVSLDPVLEPPRATTQASASLGAFGQRAPGAAIYYSETGQPMSGLRGPASGALWGRTPFERGVTGAPIGPTAYRSAGAAGDGRYRQLSPIWRNPFDASDLGRVEPRVREFNTGDVSRDAATFAWQGLTAAQRAPFRNAVDRWNRIGVNDRVSSRASWSALLAEVPDYSASAARAWWTGLSKNQRDVRRKKYTKGYGGGVLDDVANITKSVVQVVPVYGQVVAAGINAAQGQGAFKDPLKAAAYIVGGSAGGQLAPFISKRGLRLTPDAMKEAVGYNIAVTGAAANAAPAGSMRVPQLPANVRATGQNVAQVVRRIPSSAIPASARRIGTIDAKAGPLSVSDVLARMRSSASVVRRPAFGPRVVLTPQQYDSLRRVSPALSGVSLNWSLSGTTDSAAAAVAAVSLFIKRNGRPPQIKVPAVLAMQTEVPGLVQDGLWGNNTAKAAAWALSKPVSAMPAVATVWAKKPATWAPPTAAAATPAAAAPPAQLPAPQPAPSPAPPVNLAPRPTTTPAAAPRPTTTATSAPAAAKPETRKSLAGKAINAVRAFIKQKSKPPAIAVAAVRTYQSAAGLKNDGLYGEVTRNAAARDLGVSASSLPTPHQFKKPSSTTTSAAPSSKPTPVVVVASTPAPATPAPTKPTTTTKPPSSSKPSTRRELAQKAVNAVQAFINQKGKPPAIAVAAVRTYQTKAGLEPDGLWGDVTRNAAARDLGVYASTLPEVAPAFRKKRKPSAPPVVVATPSGPVVVTSPSSPGPYDEPPAPPPVIVQTPSGPVAVTPAPGPFEAPPAPPEPYPAPPAPPEPSKSSGQGLLLVLAYAVMMRRKKRAA